VVNRSVANSEGPAGAHQPSDVSLFWQRIGEMHARDLETFGLDDVKRRQSLRYFTWQWRLRHATGSEQLRDLLRSSSFLDLVRSAIEPCDLKASAWKPLPWNVTDRWFYTFAVRVLWRYALRFGASEVMSLPEPRLGNPPPVTLGGKLISQDLANTALEVMAIRRLLADSVPDEIMEIGAGYGRTAYALLAVYPHSRYTVVDIEPALSISRWYLSSLYPGRELAFMTPAQARSLPHRSVDLALSISSLHEMTHGQVEDYIGLMDRTASGGSVYLKQWADWTNPDDGIRLEFEKYPIPDNWHQRFRERAPIQVRFIQAGWKLE
jgi:putative sugar O-methyltransferase